MQVVVGLVARRLLTLVPLMLGIILFAFMVMALSPNNSARAVLGDRATPTQVAAFEHEHGLDEPLPVQYVDYVGNLLHGDLGETFSLSQPIGQIIGDALPVTMQLTALAVTIAVAVALVLGITGALFRDRWPDQLTRLISMAGIALPSFWLAILLIDRKSVV